MADRAEIFYHEWFFFQRRLWRRWELMQWGLERSLFVLAVVAAVRYDFLPFIFNCWFAPALMVGVTLGLFFDYLPHRPFASRNRWTNARIYPGRLMNWLIMGQNYHLVHHLWPSIPWFEYKPAYEATKPLLDAKGSPSVSASSKPRKTGSIFSTTSSSESAVTNHDGAKCAASPRFCPHASSVGVGLVSSIGLPSRQSETLDPKLRGPLGDLFGQDLRNSVEITLPLRCLAEDVFTDRCW